MLALGAGGVVLAIFIGWLTARLFRPKDREGTPPDYQSPEPGPANPP
jgi:hypothetical protein